MPASCARTANARDGDGSAAAAAASAPPRSRRRRASVSATAAATSAGRRRAASAGGADRLAALDQSQTDPQELDGAQRQHRLQPRGLVHLQLLAQADAIGSRLGDPDVGAVTVGHDHRPRAAGDRRAHLLLDPGAGVTTARETSNPIVRSSASIRPASGSSGVVESSATRSGPLGTPGTSSAPRTGPGEDAAERRRRRPARRRGPGSRTDRASGQCGVRPAGEVVQIGGRPPAARRRRRRP